MDSIPAHPVRAETVVELLQGSAASVLDESGAERSAAEILAAGTALAVRLAEAGVGPGDRVAVRMANHGAYLDLWAAAAVGRFTIAAVNTRFADAAAQSIIGRSGAALVISSPDDPILSAAESAAELTGGVGAEAVGPGAARPVDRFAIFTTSGTTSEPKLVVHDQRSAAVHAGDVAQAFGCRPESVVLIALPLCGVFGFSTLWSALAGHSRVIVHRGFEAQACGAAIEGLRVTHFHGSDDMFHRLLATDHDLSSIETAGYGRFNSALDSVVDRCGDRGVPLAGLYGMSEVQALFSFRGGPAAGGDAASVWRAGGTMVSADAECRVVDGELQLRGPSLFQGYLADGGVDIDTELTEAAYDGQWFRTGDLAEIDGPRSFEFVTRMGDSIRVGGFLVAPAEIEAVLMGHEAIAQAQVVAVGTEAGERPVAFVIPEPGRVVDQAEAISHCAEHLARFKCPVLVVSVPEFPVTDGPNGIKIQRAVLRHQAAELLQA